LNVQLQQGRERGEREREREREEREKLENTSLQVIQKRKKKRMASLVVNNPRVDLFVCLLVVLVVATAVVAQQPSQPYFPTSYSSKTLTTIVSPGLPGGPFPGDIFIGKPRLQFALISCFSLLLTLLVRLRFHIMIQ